MLRSEKAKENMSTRTTAHILVSIIAAGVITSVIFTFSSLLSEAPLESAYEETTVENGYIADEAIRLAAAGDFGMGDNAEAVLKKIEASSYHASLMLGDLGYGGIGTELEWCEFLLQNSPQTKHYVVVGNHDDGNKDGDLNAYLDCMEDRPDSYTGEYGVEYYFDIGQLVRIILVSPDIDNYGYDYSEGTENYIWTQNAISFAKQLGVDWIILAMHKNCITPGTKSCEIGKDLINLAISSEVDLILQGHEHNYFRSKQLRVDGSDCEEIKANSFNEACINNFGNSFIKGKGTVIAISGAGGRELREMNFRDVELEYFDSWSASNSSESYGYLELEIQKDKLSAKFVSALGNHQDEFTLTKAIYD